MKWTLWVLVSALATSSLAMQDDAEGEVFVDVDCVPMEGIMGCERIFYEWGQQQETQRPLDNVHAESVKQLSVKKNWPQEPNSADEGQQVAAEELYFKCQVELRPSMKVNLEQQTCRALPARPHHLQCSVRIPMVWRNEVFCIPMELTPQASSPPPQPPTDGGSPLDLVRVTCAPAMDAEGKAYCSCSHGVRDSNYVYFIPYFDSLECRVRFKTPGMSNLSLECFPYSLSTLIQGIDTPIPFLRACSLIVPRRTFQAFKGALEKTETSADLVRRAANRKNGGPGLVRIKCRPRHPLNGNFTCKCNHGVRSYSSEPPEMPYKGICRVVITYSTGRSLENKCTFRQSRARIREQKLFYPHLRPSKPLPTEVSPGKRFSSLPIYTCSVVLPKTLLPFAFWTTQDLTLRVLSPLVTVLSGYVPSHCSHLKECAVWDRSFGCVKDEDCALCLEDLRKFFPQESISESMCRA